MINKNDGLFDWLNDDESNINDRAESGHENDQIHEEVFRSETRDSEINSKEDNVKQTPIQSQQTQESQNWQYYNSDNRRAYDPFNENIKDYVDEKIKKSKSKFGFLKALALVLVGSIIGSFIGMNYLPKKYQAQAPQQVTQGQEVKISANEEYNIENAVAKKAIPSVVGVQVNIKKNVGFGLEAVEGQAIGSGIILSADGYILTNAHVVAGSDRNEGVNILFHDNTNAQAKVLWEDTTLDLAILKTLKKGLTPIELGDSDEVQVGHKSIAIGNPVGLNLQSTLTSGYISGINRSIQMQDGSVLDGLFQTDAAINSGNSGGALLNKQGQLIGVNTAKVQSTDGIGFAIPVNIVKPVINSFLEKGNFESVVLGIRGVNLDIYRQRYMLDDSYKDIKGVIVMDVPDGGNASKADIRVNDIILEINGQHIESMNKLKQVLLTINAGDSVDVKILRNKTEKTVKMEFMGKTPNI